MSIGPVAGAATEVRTVPARFHIFASTSSVGNVTTRQIDDRVSVLDIAYAGKGFVTTIAAVERIANAASRAMSCGNTAETSRTNTRGQESSPHLDFHAASIGGGLLGWATFPGDRARKPGMGGGVIRRSSLPGGTAARRSLVDAAAHEIGHRRGLYHTLQGGYTRNNDCVSDTPQERTAASGCPSPVPDACKQGSGPDPVCNFIPLADDACMNHHTAGQATHMRSMIARYRPGLV